MRHAFFADMGGFLLITPDGQPQSLNADLLLLLIEKNYVQYPDYDKAFIDDKNKNDGIARYDVCQSQRL